MANPKHLEILEKGVEVWNGWREENPGICPDLRKVNLTGVNLTGANLSRANLRRADLSGTIFVEADFTEADLSMTTLDATDLGNAVLKAADLRGATISGASLTGADLIDADLSGADISKTDLSGVIAGWTNFDRADVTEADFKGANIIYASFGDVDLSQTRGLDTTEQEGPSTIGIDTIYKSQGKIPESFLRGCGVPKDFIELIPSLTGKPFDFYSCFISYSSKDDDFTRRLHADLQGNKVRVWFAPEDMKTGDKIRDRLDQSIRLYDKLLLILTEDSIQSDWVEKEVETAFEKERRNPGKTVLFPIRLDDAVMDTDKAWAADIRRTRHIGDFTGWKNHDAYQKNFDRLLRDLKASEE